MEFSINQSPTRATQQSRLDLNPVFNIVRSRKLATSTDPCQGNNTASEISIGWSSYIDGPKLYNGATFYTDGVAYGYIVIPSGANPLGLRLGDTIHFHAHGDQQHAAGATLLLDTHALRDSTGAQSAPIAAGRTITFANASGIIQDYWSWDIYFTVDSITLGNLNISSSWIFRYTDAGIMSEHQAEWGDSPGLTQPLYCNPTFKWGAASINNWWGLKQMHMVVL